MDCEHNPRSIKTRSFSSSRGWALSKAVLSFQWSKGRSISPAGDKACVTPDCPTSQREVFGALDSLSEETERAARFDGSDRIDTDVIDRVRVDDILNKQSKKLATEGYQDTLSEQDINTLAIYSTRLQKKEEKIVEDLAELEQKTKMPAYATPPDQLERFGEVKDVLESAEELRGRVGETVYRQVQERSIEADEVSEEVQEVVSAHAEQTDRPDPFGENPETEQDAGEQHVGDEEAGFDQELEAFREDNFDGDSEETDQPGEGTEAGFDEKLEKFRAENFDDADRESDPEEDVEPEVDSDNDPSMWK